jgi:F420H(2)-dependent quinone reductase
MLAVVDDARTAAPGQPRSTPVIAIPDGPDWLVVASNGGAAT